MQWASWLRSPNHAAIHDSIDTPSAIEINFRKHLAYCAAPHHTTSHANRITVDFDDSQSCSCAKSSYQFPFSVLQNYTRIHSTRNTIHVGIFAVVRARDSARLFDGVICQWSLVAYIEIHILIDRQFVVVVVAVLFLLAVECWCLMWLDAIWRLDLGVMRAEYIFNIYHFLYREESHRAFT